MQIIAGIVEHRFSDAFSSQILLVNMLSFVVRTLNSYWGTQVRNALTSSILEKTHKITYFLSKGDCYFTVVFAFNELSEPTLSIN